MTIHQQILKDTDGNEIGVFMPMKDYNAILKMLEDGEDIRDFDAVEKTKEETIPFAQAIREIEAQRNDL